MGFKHALLQRSYEVAPSPARTTPNSLEGAAAGVGAAAPAQAHVTDFSISRILGGEKDVVAAPKTLATSDILDLSKTRTTALTYSAITPTLAYPNPMLTHDFLAMANATKFYAQFFPHLLPAYAAAAAAAGLSTPPTSPYQQKRYFAPYIINNQRTKSGPPTNLASSVACTRPDCIECLEYYKQYGVGYKATPMISPAASSVSSNSSRPGRDLMLSAAAATNISLTTVTNLSLSSNHGLVAQPTAAAMAKAVGGVTSSVGFGISSSGVRAAVAAEEISYKCRICDKVFGCSETLQAHEKTHKSPRYECTDCGKGFSQLRNYKYHLSVHRGTKEFAAECPECGKTFNDKGYLSSHMKIHRNRKEYECPYCPKSFNQRVAFNMHVRIHTGVKPHKCAECGKRFSRKMLLKQHMRTHSGEKPYQCSVCGKSFADRSNMTLHHRLHSGIKPFSCPLCPKAFTKKHHLKTHLNYHTGCKPYVCPHPNCNQAFTQSSNMRTHAKKCQYRPLDGAPAFPATVTATAAATATATTTASTTMAAKPQPLALAMATTTPSPYGMPAAAAFPPAQQTLLSNLRPF
ncbi:zinc finger protein 250 [Scaptodrosophila lebanonensis]|uniref:Zinc finger protein 250 n=1 Tax=Drosophila lebanonensis TaxID=7225 RepID=A0A6J2TQN0_DROLE|nr:zinc finger protein 250 [Scaptodrosophila lebanonensis]